MIAGMHDLIGKFTVIGDDQRAAGVIVQTPHREHALFTVHQIDDRLPAAIVAGCAKRALRLVHEIIHLILPDDLFAIHLDDIAFLHLCAQTVHDFSVYLYPAFHDILFGLASGCDAAGRDHLLQSFHAFALPCHFRFLCILHKTAYFEKDFRESEGQINTEISAYPP